MQDLTTITVKVSPREYKYMKNLEHFNCKGSLSEQIIKAYEAEQNKIGPGDWFKADKLGMKRCAKLDNNSSLIADDNGDYWHPDQCTKLSPEAQDILNKETGKNDKSA